MLIPGNIFIPQDAAFAVKLMLQAQSCAKDNHSIITRYCNTKICVIALVIISAVNAPRFLLSGLLEFSSKVVKMDLKKALSSLSERLVHAAQSSAAVFVFTLALMISIIYPTVFNAFSAPQKTEKAEKRQAEILKRPEIASLEKQQENKAREAEAIQAKKQELADTRAATEQAVSSEAAKATTAIETITQETETQLKQICEAQKKAKEEMEQKLAALNEQIQKEEAHHQHRVELATENLNKQRLKHQKDNEKTHHNAQSQAQTRLTTLKNSLIEKFAGKENLPGAKEGTSMESFLKTMHNPKKKGHEFWKSPLDMQIKAAKRYLSALPTPTLPPKAREEKKTAPATKSSSDVGEEK